MSGIPRVRDYIRNLQDLIKPPERVYSPEEAAVAEWLRGERMKLESLANLFLCRIERRALSPAPSTEDKAEVWARDREARELLVWLVDLEKAPATMNLGDGEDQ